MKVYFAISAAVFLSACASAPINLQTPKGTVTCQNYLDDILLWDRAISHPSGMTKAEADFMCRDAGAKTLYKKESGLKQ